MKTLKKTFLLFAFTFALFSGVEAQQFAVEKANELYKSYAYSEALEAYQRLLKKDQDNEYFIQQIAYCYDKMGLYEKALEYFELHVQGNRARYEDYYRYASLLLIDEQFEKAVAAFQNCMERNSRDERPAKQIERINNFEQLNLLHLVDTVFNLSFNTRFADMSATFFNDTIAFVSARDSSGNTYSWNNQPFLDIYHFAPNKKGVTEIQKFPGVNTKYHEGPLFFTNNDSVMYFTRNNVTYSRSEGTNVNNLRIYKTRWNGKKWDKASDFQYNSQDYSVGHPAFSKNERRLYFASNMEGSLGETDLFYVDKIDSVDKKGRPVEAWSAPVNMGSQINTAGKEMFPFIDNRGVIFFSSDGLMGFGGLDIFAAFPVADTFNVINLGQPVNSTYDDFGFIVDEAFKQGYLTSSRGGGKGSDDLYSFNIGVQHLFLYVLSLENKEAVENAKVYLVEDDERILAGNTNQEGLIKLDVEFDKDYMIEVEHSRYLPNSDSLKAFDIFKLNDYTKTMYVDMVSQLSVLTMNKETGDPVSDVSVDIEQNGKSQKLKTDRLGRINLSLKETGVMNLAFHKEGFISASDKVEVNDLQKGTYGLTVSMEPIYAGKTFTLENLYYDVNSSLIRDDAKLVLDELYEILTEFPTIKIELSSHTDCRASADYNQRLSQKRAQSAVDYLVSKGIIGSRMIAKGYGESRLLNRCADGVECSEEEHQVNRRTEFKVLEF